MIKSKNVWNGLYAINKKHKPKELKKVTKIEPENNLNPRPYVVWLKGTNSPFSCKDFDFYFYGIKVKISELYKFVMNEKGDKMIAILNHDYYSKLTCSLEFNLMYIMSQIKFDKKYFHPNKYKHGWTSVYYLTKTFNITKEMIDYFMLNFVIPLDGVKYNINETKVYIGE